VARNDARHQFDEAVEARRRAQKEFLPSAAATRRMELLKRMNAVRLDLLQEPSD